MNKKTSTQLLSELLPKLRELRDTLEETEDESIALIHYAHNHNLVSTFKFDTEVIIKDLKRLYYTNK